MYNLQRAERRRTENDRVGIGLRCIARSGLQALRAGALEKQSNDQLKTADAL